MASDVNVKIKLSNPVGSVGFGVPMLVYNASDLVDDDMFDKKSFVLIQNCYSADDITVSKIPQTVPQGNEEKIVEEVKAAANMIFKQENRPEKIHVLLTDGEDVEGDLTQLLHIDFRQIVFAEGYSVDPANNFDLISDIKNFCENYGKMFFYRVSSTFNEEFPQEADKSKRVVCVANQTPNAAVALVGATAGRKAGSFTYKFKTLKGVTAEVIDEVSLENIHDSGCIAYVTRAGDDITSEGHTTDGTQIDETDAIDYVTQNIEYRIQKVLNGTAKVPYDDRGIALLEAATVSALQDAAVNGIIATKEDGSYDYSVYFAPRSATTEADRKDRSYSYGTFKFALAGAIHAVNVYGEITY